MAQQGTILLIATLCLGAEQYMLESAAPVPPMLPLAAPAIQRTLTNIFSASVRAHFWLCVQQGTNWVPFETNFDWAPPVYYTNIIAGTNRGTYSVTVIWDPYPANLHTNTGPVPEPYDFTWTYHGVSNFVGEIYTTNVTVVLNPAQTNVVTVHSVSPTMEVTSNLTPPITWLPVSTNNVRLTNPLGIWFYQGTNVTISLTH